MDPDYKRQLRCLGHVQHHQHTGRNPVTLLLSVAHSVTISAVKPLSRCATLQTESMLWPMRMILHREQGFAITHGFGPL